MGTYHSPQALAAAQKRKFDACIKSLKVEHWELGKTMAYEAAMLSSGGTSSAELARMGHPFGRGRGRRNIMVGAKAFVTTGKNGAKMTMKGGTRHRVNLSGSNAMSAPLLPINVQTGRLLRGWRLMPRQSRAMQVLILQNVSPESKFVLRPGGTKNMVDRGFWKELKKIWKEENRRTVQRSRYIILREMSAA